MRIAIITTVHPALDARIFYKEAVAIAGAGYEVTLFAPLQKHAQMKASDYGITYVPFQTEIYGRYARPKRWLELMNLLRISTFDVWHFHDPELLPLAVLWKQMFARDVQLVYDVHEDVPKDILSKGWIPHILRRSIAFTFRCVEHWGVKNCRLVVAAVDSIGQRLADYSQQTIVVRNYPLPFIIEQDALDKKQGDAVQVIYIGNLTEPRGIREIVRAMKCLSDKNVQLTLLGYLYPESFEQEIREIADSNIKIIDKVPFEEVPNFLLKSDIGLVCLRPIPSFLESLPVKLFEYMQAGLPVIASHFPLWRDIIERESCGLLVDPEDSIAIAKAIRYLVDNPEIRREMGKAAAKAAQEKYSWQSQRAILLNAYKQLNDSQ